MERYGGGNSSTGSSRGCCHHHHQQLQPWRKRTRRSYDVIQQSFSWPPSPRSYRCSFCRREFRSAQALGGHMNVHRRDRAMLRNSSPPLPWDPPNPSRARVPNLNLSPPSAGSDDDLPISALVRDKEFEGIVIRNNVTTTTIGGWVELEDLDLELRLGYA